MKNLVLLALIGQATLLSAVDRTVTFDKFNQGPEWIMPVGAGDLGAMVSVVSNAVEMHLSKTDYLAKPNPTPGVKGLQLLSPGHVTLVFDDLKTNDVKSFSQKLDPVAGTVSVSFELPTGEISAVIYGDRATGALAADITDTRPTHAAARGVYTLWRGEEGVLPQYRIYTDMQGDGRSNAYSLLVSCGKSSREAVLKRTRDVRRADLAAWWRAFWAKGWLIMDGTREAEYLTRLWWVNMYAYAGVGYGPVPPKFNGGTGLVQEDRRHWGKDLWYQNTRELMWPMCAAGHPEFAKAILDFYDECFENVLFNTPSRYPEFAGTEAAVLPETMPFLYNRRYTPPKAAAPDVRRPYREPTDEERAKSRQIRLSRKANHISHVYSSGTELVQQMIEYVRFTGDRSYLPKIARWLRGAAELYLMLLERGEDGLWHINAAHVNESWWLVDDGIVDLAAARFALFQTVAHGKEFGYPENLIAAAKTRLDALAPFPTAERIEWGRRRFIDVKRVIPGDRIFTPCALKDGTTKNNYENNEMYLAYPFAMCESGEMRERLLRTYPESYDSDCGEYGWSSVSIAAVRLGLPQAATYVLNHAKATARWPYGGGRSPSQKLYPNACVEEAPYLDGTGVTLTGIQEMLLQSHPAEPSADFFGGGEIRKCPSVPAGWRVRFRLHARGGKVVENETDRRYALPSAEFEKYHRQITGKAPAAGAVRFAVDPAVSSSGKDAYTIVSEGAGVAITGSNLRSVYYGLYDLLERRGGCRWFWDGDVVPKKAALDLSGLNVKEEAHFEYRGLRYFAHRGLTRFQAEHWGFEDWKKEIDWCLKRRLNVFMLRIGQDDLFQRTFPAIVSYPDAAKDLPGHGKGYDNRTLFWSLEYRGKLRKNLQAYALDRGLMLPEDFGTMTHWYSRTPEEFLEKKNPQFLPQATRDYGEKNGLVWDIRDDKWVDEYWKLTKTAVREYNRPGPGLLHTIGLGERLCYTNRADNLKLKLLALEKFLKRAHRDYPDSKVLLAGWDFFITWYPEEIKALVKTLDPKRDIIWDYEGDATNDYRKNNDFTKWDIVGKFPYTYSIFLAFASALDVRANYPLIEERQKIVQNDPFCVGYILWPEASHTDTLLLRFFTENAWSKHGLGVADVLPEFCRDRYGSDAARWEPLWKKVSAISRLLNWSSNYAYFALNVSRHQDPDPRYNRDDLNNPAKWEKPFPEELLCAPEIFRSLAAIDWKRTPFTERDAIDLARTTADRLIIEANRKMIRTYHAWKKEQASAEDVVRLTEAYLTLVDTIAEVFALHTDYSLAESYDRLNAVEKIRNPGFSKVLIENATCNYCASHQYEAAEYVYKPLARYFTDDLLRHVRAGDRSKLGPYKDWNKFRDERIYVKPLTEMRPTLPRTQENYVRVMNTLAEAADIIVR